MIAKDRRVKLQAATIRKAREEVRAKYPDALNIERETVRKDVKRCLYSV